MATPCPTCQTENPDTAKFCNNCATSLHEITPAARAQAYPLAVTQTIESRTWDLATGSTFGGRYQIIELLGRGGMGRVYRAVDTKTREEVAIKLIRPDIASDKRTLERFVNEIKLAHKISHRNIGRMYHLEEDQGLHYITMEYVPGEDLKSFIRRSRRLDIGTTVAIAKQVCGGLNEAHEAGIVHRDLKPSNIMIDKDGNAKILDFGIARSVGSQGVTGEGIVIGTPEYMSPEQVEGKESDRRSDIYSFGVILFEMVTGRLPFAADTPFVVAFKQQSERPPRPEDLNPQTPPQLGAIILKCLEKDREKRYQSTEEVGYDLSQVEETMQTAPVAAPWKKPTTRKTRRPVPGLSFPWRKAFIPAVVFLGIMVAGIGVREIIPKAKGAVHTVAVAGFENLTGDAAYEYLRKAIPNLLITSLEQSKYLEVMSWERLNDITGQRDRGLAAAAERDLWFEICRREGVEAIVLGSFTKADNLFATDAKIYDVQTKNLLKSVGSRGEGVGSILRTQIDELSREISKGVGLSDRAAARDAVPITTVTTASMETYELFLRGREDFERYYFDEARQSLELAAQKDPEFALPHYYLARVYANLADSTGSKKAMEEFKKLSKTSMGKGKDGLYVAALTAMIEKDTAGYVKGLKDVIRADPGDKRALVDLAWYYKNEKKYAEAIAEFDKALKIDPNFGYALNMLAYTYAEMGEPEKALKMFERYAAAQPGDANPLDSMGDLYFLTGKFDKARAKYEQALAIRPEFPSTWKLAYLYAMEGDYELALRWVDHLIAHAQTDGIRAQGYQWKGIYDYIMGRVDEALSELGRAETLARASGNPELADMALRGALWTCYDWGKFELCRMYLERRLAYRRESNQGTPTLNKVYELLYSGLLDVKGGDQAAAKKKLADILALAGGVGENEKDYNQIAVTQLNCEILFAEGAYDEAVRVFKESPPVQVNLSSYISVLQKNLPFQADFVARALISEGETAKAIAEYERLVSPDAAARERVLVHPFSRFRLAALYEAKGDLDRAVEQYEGALKVWKNADPGLPEVMAARKKLAMLKTKTAKPKDTAVGVFVPAPLIGCPPAP
jgi:tetratricopeptide (TPR) repeat protein/predicted Ser/Thr protein kinase